MSNEKNIKKQIINKASESPDIFYPTNTLNELGFQRHTCQNCGVKFWSVNDRNYCGEPECMGGYFFVGSSPAKNSMEFPQVYLEFSKRLSNEGYTPISRFPSVARWRDDLDFNIASIIGFQPFVVNGDVPPPANPLTIPQICLRFADIDNVGYTGRHHTGFTMIGQHAFESPENYTQEEYFKTLMNWFLEGMGIPKEEITVHEDAWTGGGNCGPSLEVFSGGLELGNQVYMMYDMTGAKDISQLRELNLKVLDMGMGQERCCWFSKGSYNSYEACMPSVCRYLFEKTGIEPDYETYKKFIPYSGLLNIDEVEDIDEMWREIGKKIGIDGEVLKEKIDPLAGIYSIADHSRTLLYALADGALPSNVKGGYNLRLILRRALDFIEFYKWDIDLFDVIALHAEELSPLYPELENELTGIKKIIDLEYEKYKKHKENVEKKTKSIRKKGKIPETQEFVKYYISEGITPQDISKEFEKDGTKIKTPSNFYTLVTDFFESQKVQEVENFEGIFYDYVKELPATQLGFYEDSFRETEEVNILKEFEIEGKKYLVLDKTLFYPTKGGQAHDIGYIADKKVVDVFMVHNIIIHEVE